MKTDSIVDALGSSEAAILRRCRALNEAAQKLRYEGRHRFNVNARSAARALSLLERELRPHLRLEDEEVFPYVKKHMPRMEPILYYFQSEHDEFRRRLESLRYALDAFVSGATEGMDDLHETNVEILYLTSHVAAHVDNEEKNLFKVIDTEFHDHEKRALLDRIEKFEAPRSAS